PDLLVGHVPDELLDVDPAIPQRAALAVGLGDLRLEGYDALEARLEVVHGAGSVPGPTRGNLGRVLRRGPPSDPHSGRRHRPGADGGHTPGPPGDRGRVRMGRALRGHGRDGRAWRQSAPGR